MAWHWEDRALIAATLHRLDRCTPADVAALQHAHPIMLDDLHFSTEPPAWSATLGAHIRFSELHEVPIPSDAELQQVHQTSTFTLGSMVGTAAAHAAWPKYEPDEHDGAFADTSTPMLMLHGEFDPNAPLDQAVTMLDEFTDNEQYFYLIPHGMHSWGSPYPDGDSCMQTLFLDFLADPSVAPADCTEDVLPFDFDQPQLAQDFFGTDDLWD